MKEGVINIKVKVNTTERRKTLEKMNKIKNQFSKKINKIDKYVGTLTKKTREKIQIITIINESGDINKYIIERKQIIEECYQQLHNNITIWMKWKNF